MDVVLLSLCHMLWIVRGESSFDLTLRFVILWEIWLAWHTRMRFKSRWSVSVLLMVLVSLLILLCVWCGILKVKLYSMFVLWIQMPNLISLALLRTF